MKNILKFGEHLGIFFALDYAFSWIFSKIHEKVYGFQNMSNDLGY